MPVNASMFAPGMTGQLTVTWPDECEPYTLAIEVTSVDATTVRFKQTTVSDRAPALKFAGFKPYRSSEQPPLGQQNWRDRQPCQPHIVGWVPARKGPD